MSLVLTAPNGLAIRGTLDEIPAICPIQNVRMENGRLEFDHSGTDVIWDGQMTVLRDGKRVFVDTDGEEWTEDQLTLKQAVPDETSVFFVRATCTTADYVNQSTGRSLMNGWTLEQMQLRYPGAEIMPVDQAIALTEAKFLSKPEPITAEQFQHYLEVLPPENWQQFMGGEVFQMIERTSGRVTGTYARVRDRYFGWQDLAGTPARDLFDKAVQAATP